MHVVSTPTTNDKGLSQITQQGSSPIIHHRLLKVLLTFCNMTNKFCGRIRKSPLAGMETDLDALLSGEQDDVGHEDPTRRDQSKQSAKDVMMHHHQDPDALAWTDTSATSCNDDEDFMLEVQQDDAHVRPLRVRTCHGHGTSSNRTQQRNPTAKKAISREVNGATGVHAPCMFCALFEDGLH